jgi:hypothetical protein
MSTLPVQIFPPPPSGGGSVGGSVGSGVIGPSGEVSLSQPPDPMNWYKVMGCGGPTDIVWWKKGFPETDMNIMQNYVFKGGVYVQKMPCPIIPMNGMCPPGYVVQSRCPSCSVGPGPRCELPCSIQCVKKGTPCPPGAVCDGMGGPPPSMQMCEECVPPTYTVQSPDASGKCPSYMALRQDCTTGNVASRPQMNEWCPSTKPCPPGSTLEGYCGPWSGQWAPGAWAGTFGGPTTPDFTPGKEPIPCPPGSRYMYGSGCPYVCLKRNVTTCNPVCLLKPIPKPVNHTCPKPYTYRSFPCPVPGPPGGGVRELASGAPGPGHGGIPTPLGHAGTGGMMMATDTSAMMMPMAMMMGAGGTNILSQAVAWITANPLIAGGIGVAIIGGILILKKGRR